LFGLKTDRDLYVSREGKGRW